MKINIFEYTVDTQFPDRLLEKKIVINTINPHSFCVAEKDNEFKRALLSSDVLIPDGIGIVLAVKLLKRVKIKRIAGADMHSYLLDKALKHNLKVFYLGSSDSVLEKIKLKLNEEYPQVSASFYSPPYKSSFTEIENSEMVEAVNTFSPDILFVGMTAPKQEKWVAANKDKLNVSVITSIGAVFDFYAGNVKRAPEWMIGIGMEWLFRFIKEPKRMWRRYLINNTRFMYYLIKEKLK